jgi:hypothetical protein
VWTVLCDSRLEAVEELCIHGSEVPHPAKDYELFDKLRNY